MTTTSLMLCLGIITSSFFGSWHCGAMCGPIASLMGVRKNLWSYHLGRGLAYVVLGLVAGGVGELFLTSSLVHARVLSALLMSGLLFYLGFSWIFPSLSSSKLSDLKHVFLKTLSPKSSFLKSGFLTGLMTALLPCGWLYTYALAAAASQSGWSGALVMFLFWLGGLPILSAAPSLLRQGITAAGLRQQKIAGAILMTASIYSIFSFFFFHGH